MRPKSLATSAWNGWACGAALAVAVSDMDHLCDWLEIASDIGLPRLGVKAPKEDGRELPGRDSTQLKSHLQKGRWIGPAEFEAPGGWGAEISETSLQPGLEATFG